MALKPVASTVITSTAHVGNETVARGQWCVRARARGSGRDIRVPLQYSTSCTSNGRLQILDLVRHAPVFGGKLIATTPKGSRIQHHGGWCPSSGAVNGRPQGAVPRRILALHACRRNRRVRLRVRARVGGAGQWLCLLHRLLPAVPVPTAFAEMHRRGGYQGQIAQGDDELGRLALRFVAPSCS